MSRDPAAEFDALLGACTDVLGRIEARVASRLGDPAGDAEWGDVGDAGGFAALASDACPACGSADVAVTGAVPGLALGRVEEGRFAPAGETELDWSAWRPLRVLGATALACPGCGARWAHPGLRPDED